MTHFDKKLNYNFEESMNTPLWHMLYFAQCVGLIR